jgi:hypothetical protein
MAHLEDPGIRTMVVGLLVLAALLLGARAARMIAGALRHARALDLIRGIRVGILAFVAGCFGLGVHSGRSGFIVLGALVLGEELYETGVLALIIRRGERG